MKINLYTIVKYLSLFCAPFAPAVFFGSKVYAGLLSAGVGWQLSLFAAICAAIALETVGLLAGHTMVDFVGVERYGLAGLSLMLLACYVIIGVLELQGTIGAVMFIVALLVYLLVALKQYSEKLDHQKEAKRDEQKEDKAATLQARIAVKLAEIEANKQVEIAKIAPPQNVAHAIAPQQNTQQIDRRAMILQLHQSGIKQADIARQLGVNPSTVTRTIQANNRISAD